MISLNTPRLNYSIKLVYLNIYNNSLYIGPNIAYSMIKDKIAKSEVTSRSQLKNCYGTSEWSENSGICRNCKLKDACGKMHARHSR